MRSSARALSGLHHSSGVLLVGAPGVGKTALARALLVDMRAGAPDEVDAQWLIAAATGPGIPFAAFGPLVHSVGGRPGPAAAPDRRPDDAAGSFDLLQAVRRAVLDRAGDRHLILVVDDAHRLDEASATLVFQLVATGEAAAVVTSRAGARMPDGIRALWKEGWVERIDVQPLDREQTALLARQCLAGHLDGDLSEALWQTSRGNPLYLRELLIGRPGRPSASSWSGACGACGVPWSPAHASPSWSRSVWSGSAAAR